AFALVIRPLRLAARRAQLRHRPLSVPPAELREALGHRNPVELLRGPVLAAMPTIASLERRLLSMGTGDGEQLLAVAARIRAHEFDLLGSGPTALRKEIDWLRDFKSGR